MFFFMKFCFWLALVYAAILYGVGPFGSSQDGHATGTISARTHDRATIPEPVGVLHGVVDVAASSVAGLCANHPADCLAEAARLRALFEASAADVMATNKIDPAASNTIVISRDAPMPVPDPRRQVRALKLTPNS